MTVLIQLRRDTIENWESANPILAQGEFAIVLASKDIRIGDGSSLFTELPNVLTNTSEEILLTGNEGFPVTVTNLSEALIKLQEDIEDITINAFTWTLTDW